MSADLVERSMKCQLREFGLESGILCAALLSMLTSGKAWGSNKVPRP